MLPKDMITKAIVVIKEMQHGNMSICDEGGNLYKEPYEATKTALAALKTMEFIFGGFDKEVYRGREIMDKFNSFIGEA